MFTYTQHMTDDCMGAYDAYKTFTRDEYTQRLERLQTNMARHGCDVLLLTSPENITYVTGYRTWYFSSKFRPVICVVPQTGEPALVLRILEKSTVRLTSWAPHVYCWGSASRNLGALQAADPAAATALAVRELAGSPATVGIEAGDGARFNAPLTLLDELRTAMGGIMFIDGTRAIQDTRMIKTEWEVSRLRKACGATEDAIEAAFARVQPGATTESDLARWIAAGMTERGVDRISYLTIISGDAKYSTFNAYATGRTIRSGDIVLADISGHIDGYASDLTRTAIVGRPSAEQARMAQAANDSVMRCIEAMRPGVPISRISRVAEDTIREAGYGQYLVHSSGHGIGLDVVEYPMISPSQETILEPGMTFAVEQGVYPYRPEDGVEGIYWCFRTEDLACVTETGAELLSGPGPALIEL